MKIFFRPLILTGLLAWSAVFAAGDTNAPAMPTAPRDPVLERVSAATARQDWAGAQSILREAIARDSRNADYHNMYAYTIRKGATPDMNLVFKHYNEALALDPKHRGAHQYLGEAYLMVGNVAKAKEHLGVLDQLCFFPCDEFSDLKRAIGEYEAKRR